MARRRKPEGSIWPKLLGLIIICVLIGGTLGYYGGYFQSRRITRLLAPAKKSPQRTFAQAAPVKDLSRLSRSELEREVRRLNDEIQSRDRHIGDLMIRLKIATSGSHTKKQ